MSDMFLTSGYVAYIEKIINWLEGHPQSVEIIKTLIATLIPCICFREILIFALKPYIERRNKQIQAETVFYPVLRMKVTILEDLLKKNNRLEVLDVNAGNIFIILYKENVRHSYCSEYKSEIPENEISLYKNALGEIKEVIEKTDVNVPPKKCSREEWEKSQVTLMLFYKTIEAKSNGMSVEVVTEKATPETKLHPIHIEECEKLIQALKCLSKHY